MPIFSLRHPYFIVVCCLLVFVLGLTSVVQMPVDMFPPINIPVVLVATFYSGMPPEEIEADITGRFERFFTLGSGIDHMESRSLPGVSLIKIYFQPGTDADADVTEISNLAMADLRRLPQGTLPPVVLKVDASTLPVCLLTVEGRASRKRSSAITSSFRSGIRSRMFRARPCRLHSEGFTGKLWSTSIRRNSRPTNSAPMDVVRATNESNLILPAGDVRIGPTDYNIYTNAQVADAAGAEPGALEDGRASAPCFSPMSGHAVDGAALQYNIVRVNGQRSSYVPVLKQGGDTNTISVVNGIKEVIPTLRDIPEQLKAHVVFDQSLFVKQAISTVMHEGGIGLLLTALMILIFLGSMRATLAVFLSIPISLMATFFVLHLGGGTINSMVLSGLALAFSRLIDNSVVVLENIYRHVEHGESPVVAAEKGSERSRSRGSCDHACHRRRLLSRSRCCLA